MLNYQSYKGRVININKKVMIYRNLHNGMFSIKQDGLVVAHVDSIFLSSAIFKVNQSGRNRVIKEQKKNVHAFVIGYVKSVNVGIDLGASRAVSYNPYKYGHFYFKIDESQVSSLGYDNVYCSISSGLFVG